MQILKEEAEDVKTMVRCEEKRKQRRKHGQCGTKGEVHFELEHEWCLRSHHQAASKYTNSQHIMTVVRSVVRASFVTSTVRRHIFALASSIRGTYLQYGVNGGRDWLPCRQVVDDITRLGASFLRSILL